MSEPHKPRIKVTPEMRDLARRILNPQDLNDGLISHAWDQVADGCCKQINEQQAESRRNGEKN